MSVPKILIPVARILKNFLKKSGRICVRNCPFIFKGEKILVSTEEADNYLSRIYPDKKSSCWCTNNVESNPEYHLHIVISAFNVDKFINQCVDSILSQATKYKYCISIVNDGSTDKTLEKLDKYKGLSNIQIINQDNKGYSGARNVALSHIKGQYVMFVDSDDFLEGNALETLLDIGFKKNADIVQGSFNRVDVKSEVLSKKILKRAKSRKASETEILSQPWAKIFKADRFKNIHFPEGYWYEDTIVKFIIVPNSGLKVTIPEVVYNYRIHPGTVIQQNKNPLKEIDSLYVTRSVLKDYMSRYKIDEYIYNHFLHQGSFIYNRMQFIPDEKVRRNIFAVYCSLFENYFKPIELRSKRFPIIKKALEEKDYKLFCTGCKFYT